MTIFIHIGMQKTGSSALETTFAANRPVLAQFGVDYPSIAPAAARVSAAHHELVWALQEGRPRIADPERVIRDASQVISESVARKIVLSSESFCDLKADQIAALKALLPDRREVRIVCYFRNQIDWVESFLNHKIKASAYKSVRRIVPGWTGKTDYFAMIERWAAIFGEPAIVARVYTPGFDTVRDFLEVIGEPGLVLEQPPKPINVSLSAPLLRMKVVANGRGHNVNIRRLLNDIQIATRMGPRTRLLTAEERQAIIAIAKPSNKRLWRKYLAGQGKPFKLKAEVPDEAAAPISTKALLEILAHTVSFQQQQLDDLAQELKRLKNTRSRRGQKAAHQGQTQASDS